MPRTAAKAAEAPAVVLEEGTNPETGRDRNSSVPRPFNPDAPVSAEAAIAVRIAGVERELAAYEQAGKRARADACRAELRRLAKVADTLAEPENTDDAGPEEVA